MLTFSLLSKDQLLPGRLLIRNVTDSLLVWLCIRSTVIRLEWQIHQVFTFTVPLKNLLTVHYVSRACHSFALNFDRQCSIFSQWSLIITDDRTRDYPYHASTDALRMLCNSNLGRHITRICTHLDASVCPREAGLLLRTDGLSLTLSTVAVSPTNAISCSSAWGERHQ